jgi:hypothetical protein
MDTNNTPQPLGLGLSAELGVGVALPDESAQITRRGAFSCQACIPKHWTDEQAKSFTDRENLCGTTSGWFVRKQGDPALGGCDERVPCEQRGPNFVHVMFDA